MEAVLYIDGEITPFDGEMTQEFFGPATSLKAIRKQLEKSGTYSSARVKINSIGGSVSEGFAIADYLTSLQVPVTTEIFGACHSIASVIFLAGKNRVIGKNATMLIHLPSGGVYGTSDDIEAYNAYIQGEKTRVINYYVERTGIDRNQVEDLMRKETNLKAQEAKDLGFATSVMEPAMAKATYDFSPQATTQSNMSQDTSLLAKLKALILGTEPQGKAVKNLALNSDKGDLTVHTTAETELPAVGDQIDLDGKPAPDDEYVVSATGLTIKVQEGKISNIETPETPSDEEMKKIEELEAKNAALENKNTALEQKVSSLETKLEAEAKVQKEHREKVENLLKNVTSKEAPAVADDMESKGTATNKAEDVDDIVARNLAKRNAAKNTAK